MPNKLKTKTILIVDDFREMAELFKDILSFNKGYHVSTSNNGRQAIEMYKDTPYDLVILDLFLPDINGVEVIEKLSAEFSSIKFIVVSGGGKENQLELDNFLKEANHRGVKRCLQKPCDPELFLKTVMEVLSE